MKYRLILGSIFGTVLAGIGITAIVAGALASRDDFVRSEPTVGFFVGIMILGGVIALICAATVLLWALGGRRNKLARVLATVMAFGAGISSAIIGLVFAIYLYGSISGYIAAHAHGHESSPLWLCAISACGTLFFFALAKVFFVKSWKSNKREENGYIKTVTAQPTQNGEKPIKPLK